MKRYWAIGLIALAVAIVGGIYLSKAGRAPAGQPLLVEINNRSLPSLQAEFNRSTADTRVILLLSPT